MTNCELKIIIEIEIGIFGPLLLVGLTGLKKRRPGQLVQFYSIRTAPVRKPTSDHQDRCLICMQDYACFDNLATSRSTGKAALLQGRALLKGREKTPAR